MRIRANDSNEKILHKELSYVINGLLFKVHNELGRFCREKQYGDAFNLFLKESGLLFEREKVLPVEVIDNGRTNVVDFAIENKILVDVKAKPIVTKEDYYQMQRYLHAANCTLGILVNFHAKYLRPIRIIRIHS